MNSKNAYSMFMFHVCSNVNIRVTNEAERFIIKKEATINPVFNFLSSLVQEKKYLKTKYYLKIRLMSVQK